MWCQIWRFHLKNTLKSARKKKKNVKESATLFFKTALFFYGVFTTFCTCLGTSIRPSMITKNIAGIKLEKKMWCQIMRFLLRNTLKSSRKKQKKSRNPQQCFSKLCPFLRSFDVVSYRFRCINPTFHINKKCSWDKTGQGIMV